MPDYLDVIVVDFDDTICPFSEDFSCTQVVPGAKEYIEKLKAAGYKITISSARNNVVYGGHSGATHRQMYRFLSEKGIPFDHIDLGTDGKPVAYRYIDDRAVGCPRTKEGWVDWPKVYDLIVGTS
jgi:hypothetical protein